MAFLFGSNIDEHVAKRQSCPVGLESAIDRVRPPYWMKEKQTMVTKSKELGAQSCINPPLGLNLLTVEFLI